VRLRTLLKVIDHAAFTLILPSMLMGYTVVAAALWVVALAVDVAEHLYRGG